MAHESGNRPGVPGEETFIDAIQRIGETSFRIFGMLMQFARVNLMSEVVNERALVAMRGSDGEAARQLRFGGHGLRRRFTTKV